MPHEASDPQALIDSYGPDAIVVVGDGEPITLGQALQFEEMFCSADPSARQDPEKRVQFIAGMLAAGQSLRDEHWHLLPMEG